MTNQEDYFNEKETKIMRNWLKQKKDEMEDEMDKEYEEAMWEQILKDGPPQNNDIEWIKARIFDLTVDAVVQAVTTNEPIGTLASSVYDHIMEV